MTDNVRVALPLEYEQRVKSLAGLLRWRRSDELRLIEALDDDGVARGDDLEEPARALQDAVSIVLATLRARGIPCTRENASRAVIQHALALFGAGARA
jgi:hypothetical protein